MKAIDALEHMTSEGERWDNIAWRYYGDPYAYGRIIAANPAAPISPILPAGLSLLIPIISLEEQLQQTNTDELPPWKRS